MIRKIFWGLIILTIVSWLFLFLRRKFSVNESNAIVLNNLAYVVNFLKNLEVLPYPKGNLILLDKNFNVIHLTDKDQSIFSIKDLYIIQGNLCSLLEDYPELSGKVYDPKFSVANNKKCFTYSVTKDGKYFQIGALLELPEGGYFSIVTGNYFSGSIIKDFASNNMVLNGDLLHYPYSPTYNFELLVKKVKGNFTLSSLGDCKIKNYFDNKSDKVITPTKGLLSNCTLIFSGSNFVAKIIYPDGSVQIVSPLNNKFAQIKINFYNYNGILTKKVDIVNKLGKMVYSLVKFDKNSDIKYRDKYGNYLIIRGTKFSFEADKINSYVYLDKGSIELINSLGQIYNLFVGSLKGFGKNRVFELLNSKVYKNKVSDLVSTVILYNFVTRPSLNFNITDNTKKFSDKFNILPKPISQLFNAGITNLERYLKINTGYLNYGVFIVRGEILRPDQIFSGKNLKYIRDLDSNDILNDTCKVLGYNEAADINDFHNFVKGFSFNGGNILFNLREELIKNVGLDYLILMRNNFKQSFLNFTFYEPSLKRILYSTLPIKKVTNKGEGYKGIVFICK